jgi:argininosuccinate lyase
VTQENKKESLWGGGFAESMHPTLAAISESLEQDMPLAKADLRASAAYAQALGRCGVLSHADAATLAHGIEALGEEFVQGTWKPQGTEDVHTAIEAAITERLGDLGARLHTGRSRNDQVSTAFRLALAERLECLDAALVGVQKTLIDRASQEIDTLMPAYTHVQRAQPVRLAHMLLATFWPLQRDRERLAEVRARVLMLPLGAGAVSGHPFGLDREWLRETLGFVGITQNSIDTVGDRDFAVEAAFATAMVALHLSRVAEDLVMWSSSEFGYVRWPDSLATGSSLMPNKKNPDLAELVRGRSAQAVGDVVSLLVLIKGLPQSYQRDLQEDKPPVWRITAATLASVEAMQAALQGLRFEHAALKAALTDDLLATEAADVLVGRGVPFRQAHALVAACVAAGRQRNCGIKALAGTDFALPAPLTHADLEALSMEAAVERRTAFGGTARSAVMTQLQAAQDALRPKDGR